MEIRFALNTQFNVEKERIIFQYKINIQTIYMLYTVHAELNPGV